MKYKCEICSYETADKSNFNKHLNSKAHIQKNIINIDVDIDIDKNVNKKLPSMFQCPKCFKTYSSTSSLSRHKNKYCYGEIMKTNYEEEFNEKLEQTLKQKEVEMELKYSKQTIEDMKQYIKTTKPTTYNISVNKLIQQNYPDAPFLAMLEDYTVIHDDEDIDFARDLIYYHKKNKLDSYLGDIIIKYYKKDDPKEQSLWSTDSSRLKYIIKELIASNKSTWSQDDRGLKINKYVIKPLLKYIYDYINDQIDEIDIILQRATAKECIPLSQKQLDLALIREQIQNGQLQDDVNRYIAPSFRFNNDKMVMIE